MSFHSSAESLDLTNAIWDDGEWVSWAEIDRYVEGEAAEDEREVLEDDEEGLAPEGSAKDETSLQKLDRLEKQIARAQEELALGNSIGDRIGEMGELYAEARFRINRHRKCAQGSDGKIGNDFVEVKTISPWKKKSAVRVKRTGHWTKLVVVRISKQWIFEAQIYDRSDLVQGKRGKYITVSWMPGK